MKTYFCKYLPVKGEIKEGDKCIDPIVTNNRIVEALTDKEGVYIKKTGGLKVKLFLCSRDIQVGDKITYMDKYQGTLEVSTTGKYQFTDQDGGIHYLHLGDEIFGFKVIGEISPEALFYCKDGIKYSEEDLQFYTKGGGNISYKLTLKEFTEYTGPLSKIIKIKGPCGHFH